MKFAQILNGRAHWIFEAAEMPEFAPNIVLVEISGIDPPPQEGWLYDGMTFSPPSPPPLRPILPWAFLDLFTDSELEAIESLARTNAKAGVFLRRLMVQGAVSSANPRIIAGMNALVTATILTPARRDEILGSFG